MEIIGSGKPFEMGEKRFYVEGVVLRSRCPHCGEIVDRDCGDQYFSYPWANKPIKAHFYHEHRDEAGRYHDHEWEEQVILRVTIEVAPPQVPEGTPAKEVTQ